MDQIVLNSTTRQRIATFAEHPVNAVILVGPKGNNKLLIAQQLATRILGVQSLDTYPYYLLLSPEINVITIESIRSIHTFLKHKVPGKNIQKRIVIISSADTMGKEAQNALLKNLEEPPLDTTFILTTSNVKALLPTIQSRAQIIRIGKPSKEQLEKHYKDFDSELFNKALQMSGGNIGTLDALLHDSDHPMKRATDYARKILLGSTYEKLILSDEILKQTELFGMILEIMQNMAVISLQNKNVSSSKKWQHILRASYDAQKSLKSNVQPKLVITNLMLRI